MCSTVHKVYNDVRTYKNEKIKGSPTTSSKSTSSIYTLKPMFCMNLANP